METTGLALGTVTTGDGSESLLPRLRLALGITQEGLAERSGLTVRAISDIERGRVRRPRQHTCDALAEALGLTATPRAAFLRHYRPPSGRHPQLTRGPRQLPWHSGPFVGRVREIDRLVRLLASPDERPYVINGLGGVGKTALVHAVAQALPDTAFDGHLHAVMTSPDGTPRHADDLIVGFLHALGVHPTDVPTTRGARRSLWQTLARDRALLILLDDVQHADQVRPFTAGPDVRVLVTTCFPLTDLDTAARVVLGPLDPLEAAEVIRCRLPVLAAHPRGRAALARLADVCHGLPLALRLGCGQVVAAGHRPVDEVVRRIESGPALLDALSAGDCSLRVAIGHSVAALDRRTRATLAALARAGLTTVHEWQVSAAGGMTLEQAGRRIDELVLVGVIEPVRSGSPEDGYRIHPFVREYLLPGCVL